MIKQNYNNYCRKCRNSKFWQTLFDWRVAQLIKEKKDGKIIKARISKRIEEKLTGQNISAIIQKLLALEVAKQMTSYDDEEIKELKCIRIK